MTKKDFNEYRFEGLNIKDRSNKYLTMNRTNEEETKIVVRIGENHLLKTRYGYALILDMHHVVFLKEWQVSDAYVGTEVLLNKEYFNIKEWGEFEEFEDNEENLSFETWLNAAKAQEEAGTMVKWHK